MSVRFKRRVVGKAASYDINGAVDACGTIFTNRGALGAVTFRLPAPTFNRLGDFYDFRAVVDQNLLVTCTTAGDILTLNNATATTVALQTAGQLLGGGMRAECVETVSGTFKWLVQGTTVGHTYTV